MELETDFIRMPQSPWRILTTVGWNLSRGMGLRSSRGLPEAEVRSKGAWLWTLITLALVRVSFPLILWVASSGVLRVLDCLGQNVHI